MATEFMEKSIINKLPNLYSDSELLMISEEYRLEEKKRYDDNIAKMKKEITSYKDELASQSEELLNKDAEIASQSVELVNKDAEIASKDAEIEKLKRELSKYKG